MKTILSIGLSLILIASISSCGPSAAEVAAKKENLEYKIRDCEKAIQTMNQNLMNAKADYAAAKDEMGRIQGFQFLRTADEREAQIKAQSIKIQTMEKDLQALAQRIQTQESEELTLKSQLTQLH
jgi:predicted  nucleic acid-binding Zn-ribbon protein